MYSYYTKRTYSGATLTFLKYFIINRAIMYA